MHVRTSYLPDVGEQLVCRLNHDDHEILVEGRVAWRAEGQDSGEFGIQFTALDADSADVLQSLGEPATKETARSPIAPEVLDEDSGGAELFAEGARVKLHIDGLGAPMKACVHQGSTRKLRVGSSLEFLKMGRDLQVEDVLEGERRGATVDAVNVVINPTTSVPELVVQLRYEGVSPTPPPAQVDRGVPDFQDEAFTSAASENEDDDADPSGELLDDDAAPWEPAAEALRARLGGAMKSAGAAASKATSVLGSVAHSARESMMQATRGAKTSSPLRAQSAGATKRRQTTRRAVRAAPTHLRSGIHDLGLAAGKKKSSAARGVPASSPEKPRKKMASAVVFGAAFLVFGGSAFAFRTWGGDPPAVAESSADASEVAAGPATAAVASTSKKGAPKKEETEGGVVAEVPLFGPQAMAVKPKEEPEQIDLAEAEKRSAAAAVEDQSWDDAEAEVQEPQDAPWGKGRLYLPTIHRIRLDGVGASLAGAVNPDGFTVVVPGRKAMESGKTIQKRDKRIALVSTSNGAQGATVKFEFRGAVPPYRVRLRQDFVEFLISAPEDTVARL